MNALAGCVSSLTLSTETLHNTIQVMDAAVADYPRLSKVLTSNRHFELISQSDLQTAQTLLSSTIEPETDRLLKETEKQIHKMELKEKKLVADSELLETRIANSLKKGGPAAPAKAAAPAAPQPSGGGDSAADLEKLKRLKAQKQRLAYAVERLELEKRQKEMQVRKKMSYNG